MLEYNSQRSRKDERKSGVTVATYTMNNATLKDVKYISIAFKDRDADWLAYKVMLKIDEEKNRMYFEPSEKGFLLSPVHKGGSTRKIAFAMKEELEKFVGEYDGLQYDQMEHLFYIDASEKKDVAKRAKKEETVTLSKDEYEKIMSVVNALA